MIHRLTLLLAITLSICANADAQTLRDSVLIHFRQSKAFLDTTYMGNAQALEHAGRAIEFYHRPDSNFVLTNVTVVGGASPEGSLSFNRWLSRQRASRIFEYIGNRIELPDSLTTFTFLAGDWAGLRRMVIADSDVPYRDEVIAVLDNIIASHADSEAEYAANLGKLKALRGGTPYRYIYRRHFPVLRASALVMTFGHPRPVPMPRIPAYPLSPETHVGVGNESLANPYVAVNTRRPFYMSVSTNMLYDLLAVPNLGAEFYLGSNLSVAGNWMYAWWKNDLHHRYWRIYGGDIALRWWFGPAAYAKPLTGHHIGIYGGLLTYDFEWGGRGYMGGIPRGTLWDRCNHHLGIEYGYSLPVSSRWNIDFNIGFGYLGGEYQVYDPKDGCYIYRETRRRSYWGPTKAEISLVRLIGRGNRNVSRGKARKEVRHD